MQVLSRYPRFNLDVEDFLDNYWQRRPLLIRSAIGDFSAPLDANALAGLAMEPDVDSRIVERSADRWILEHGPFAADDFQRDNPWTLLVQSVDAWYPEVAALRGCVDFLPDWRFDDVMVSYASDGGSVGPHFDRYDVFLLQGEGQRLWRIGEPCDASTPRIAHDGLNLLRHFVTVEEYLLEPGDALYVPPGYAHWGIAQSECTTFSLGFRAPRMTDLMARLADTMIERLDPDLLLADESSVGRIGRPGELTRAQRDNARAAVINALNALDDSDWLGELLTETGAGMDSRADTTPMPEWLVLEPAARLLWFEEADTLRVFANGVARRCSPCMVDTLSALCAGHPVCTALLDGEARAALTDLWQSGVLSRPEDLQ